MDSLKSFETQRLFIRPTTIEDAPFILELMNSPKWLQFIGDRGIKSLENAQEYIDTKMIPQLKERGYSNYTVIRKMDSIKIGSCGLYDREGVNGIDLGFAFLPDYERKGFAFEATQRLQRAAHESFALTNLNAITTKDNLASQKLLEKLQFILIDTVALPHNVEVFLLYNCKFQ